jgi:hypothetical protein
MRLVTVAKMQAAERESGVPIPQRTPSLILSLSKDGLAVAMPCAS